MDKALGDTDCSWIKSENEVSPVASSQEMQMDYCIDYEQIKEESCDLEEDCGTERQSSHRNSFESQDQNQLDSVSSSAVMHVLLKNQLKSNRGGNSGKSDIQKHKCDECGKKFRDLKVFEKHKQYHETKKEFVCKECGKGFHRKYEFENHSRTHAGEKPFKCRFCGMAFSQKNSMKRHVGSHPEVQSQSQYEQDGVLIRICNLCGKEFDTEKKFEIHKRRHAGAKPWVCEICQCEFTQSSNYNKHMRQHKNEKPHVCPICNWRFNDQGNLQSHIRTHTGERPYICDFCGWGFNQRSSLSMHIRTHTGYKPHICHFCGKSCTRKDSLEKHIRSHTGETPFTCETCGKSFKRDDVLARHMLLHSGEKPHNCPYCDKKFRQKANLQNHVKIKHTKDLPFQCSLCGKAFVRQLLLKTHLKRHGAEIGDFNPTNSQGEACDGLEDEKSNIYNLNEDLVDAKTSSKGDNQSAQGAANQFELTGSNEIGDKIVKTNKRNVSGTDLSEESEQVNNVSLSVDENDDPKDGGTGACNADHVQNHTKNGSKGRNHKCETCGKDFGHRRNLLIHTKIHSGERHSCPQCDKTFSHENILRRHVKQVHTDGDQHKFTETKWLYQDPY